MAESKGINFWYVAGIILALGISVGVFFGGLWFAVWAVKGFFHAIGVAI